MAESTRDQFEEVAAKAVEEFDIPALAEGDDRNVGNVFAQAFRDHFAQQTCSTCVYFHRTHCTNAIIDAFLTENGCSFAPSDDFGCKFHEAKDR